MSLFLDLTGLKCPIPLMKTKKKLNEMARGETLEVTATDPHSQNDFFRFCDGRQCSVISFEQKSNKLVFIIRKEDAAK
ncbi:sulfurtransferase TusA family protein [Acinetobacter pittii]|uniref:sulfurtransferase TusA family protein n=1 Tax=Acinetobacter pittii TaxID=48296 RepID=UPI002DC02C86|nr:sulfurtransferase TusA family protein [Acinetobacter pittii]MEB7642924.1 sulfurtransferase TusA family protein [Acinetobacter pittii]